jgi:hypothetical protein
MVTDTTATDKGIGFGVALSLVAALGALVMFGGGVVGAQVTAAWGFAAAMLAATLAVVAAQVYW